MCGERKICREAVVISLKLVSCNAVLLYVCMNRLKIMLVNMITGNISLSIHDKDNSLKGHTYVFVVARFCCLRQQNLATTKTDVYPLHFSLWQTYPIL